METFLDVVDLLTAQKVFFTDLPVQTTGFTYVKVSFAHLPPGTLPF
jgi:hypothetical protein